MGVAQNPGDLPFSQSAKCPFFKDNKRRATETCSGGEVDKVQLACTSMKAWGVNQQRDTWRTFFGLPFGLRATGAFKT